MRNFATKLFVGASVLGGIGTLLRGIRFILDWIGTAETASGVAENRGAIVNWLIAVPQYVPLALFLLGVFGLLCLKFGSPALWFAKLITKPPVPQPIFVAIDQLKGWLYKGQALESRFQFPDKAKPSFGECVTWDENATACARQQVFADIIRPRDMARFIDRWDEQACRKAEATLDEHGCLEAVSEVARAVYRYIFGRVKRLEELLAHIEGKSPEVAPITESNHQAPYPDITSFIFGTPEMRQQREAQVEGLVTRSLAMLRKDKTMRPLYALQIEGAGSLESAAQFLDACERLHQRHFPHPLKHFKDITVDWLEFIRFANQEEMGLYSSAAVLDCLKKFYSATSAARLAGLSGQLDAKIKEGETAISSLKERIEESPRAEFSPIQAMLKGDGIEEFQFTIAIRNTGDCTATEMHMRGFMWDEELRRDLKVLGQQIAHDVPKDIAIEACFVTGAMPMNSAPYFVVLGLEYKPSPKLETTKQTFYFKFRGIKAGKFDPVLIIATKPEAEAIERRFAEELQRVGMKA